MCRDWMGKKPRQFRIWTSFQVDGTTGAGVEHSDAVTLACATPRKIEVFRQADAFAELAKYSTDISLRGSRGGGSWLGENLENKGLLSFPWVVSAREWWA
jgi:hypothetical protein